MTEKKIDLSNVRVGDPLWTTHDGECFAEKIRESSAGAKISAENVEYNLRGKEYTADKFPTCFHSREEFLDFHGIAPVRMTIKNLEEEASKIVRRQQIGLDTDLQIGFLLAGGQIIEEPTNLPCGNCGISVIDAKDAHGTIYHPKVNNCFLSNKTFNKEEWNDPSKRGKV